MQYGRTMDSLNIGALFGDRYRIVDVIGQGGFAKVYLAVDEQSTRRVAIKVLDDLASAAPDTMARFEREVRAVAALRDPHTVRLFDYGSRDGLLFTVFEYIAGRDLAEVLATEGPLPAPVVIHIARQVLQALREAHAAGIVHRDVKPDNVRVFEYMGDAFTVKVLDFGIAKSFHPDTGPALTAANELVGTLRYMSPEQLAGRPLRPSSDIYSLGLVMIEMLTGPDALHGNRLIDQLERMSSGHLFAVPDDVTSGLGAVITRMTERDADARYSSADAVLRALETLTAPIRSTRPAAPARSEPQPVGFARVALVIAAAVIVVAAVSIGAALVASPPEAPQPTPSFAQVHATPQPPPPVPRSTPNVAIGADAPTVDTDAAAATPRSGCGVPAMEGILRWSRREDSGLVYVPAGYNADRPVPVVITLAAKKQSPEQFFHDTSIATLADKDAFLVAAPPGDVRTVGELRAMVERIREDYCIDESRVFVLGFLAGGRAAEVLLCEPWVAGAAAASARTEAPAPCTSAKPFLLMSGMRTNQARPEGGMNCRDTEMMSLAAHETVAKGRNGCDGRDKPYFEHNGSQCRTWTCSDAPFVSCHLDGGWNWPGAAPRPRDWPTPCDGPPTDFPAAEVAWEFFKTL